MTNEWTPLIHETLTSLFGGWLVDLYKHPNKVVFPLREDVFKAFKLTPLQSVKVVIVGQDPYHGYEINGSDMTTKPEANGLAFSVDRDIKTPPSLKNIFKAVEHDLGIVNTETDLSGWAKQGVLLLNAALTVELDNPGIHNGQWQDFIKRVFFRLNKREDRLIFLLWGNKAQAFKKYIDARHFVLEAPHPSPFSAYKGFLTCGHFAEVNKILYTMKKEPINWSTDLDK